MVYLDDNMVLIDYYKNVSTTKTVYCQQLLIKKLEMLFDKRNITTLFPFKIMVISYLILESLLETQHTVQKFLLRTLHINFRSTK